MITGLLPYIFKMTKQNDGVYIYIYIYISEPGYIGQSNSILTVSHRAPINSRSLS